MKPKTLTKGSLEQWIEYYAGGDEIPDDVMVQILNMASRDADKASLKEGLDEMIIDEQRYHFEQQSEFEDSDSVDAMHNVEHSEYTLGVLRHKLKFMLGETA